MFSPYRVIPESSRIRLPTGRSSSRDRTSVVPDFVALRAFRCSRSCKRNVVRGCDRAVRFLSHIRRDMHIAIDASCVLCLSNPPISFAGEA